MTDKIKKLREERANAALEMRKMLNLAEDEKRELTSDENLKYQQFNKVIDDNAEKITREERLVSIEIEMNENANKRIDEGGTHNQNSKKEAREIIESVSRKGLDSVSKTELEEARCDVYSRYLLGEDIRAESRALQMDSDIYGGYLIAPQQFVNTLIMGVDNDVFIRQFATKNTVINATSLGMPSLDNDPADPAWTAEIATGTEDSTMSFGKRELNPHPLAKLIKLSNKLLRATSSGAEALVNDRLRYKFSVVEENAYLNGTGVNQPLGVMVASNDGITTSQDVSTGNTASTPTFDGLIECKYSLKAQYWNRIRWIFHRDCLKLIRKLKDGEGQYIWKESGVDGLQKRLR